MNLTDEADEETYFLGYLPNVLYCQYFSINPSVFMYISVIFWFIFCFCVHLGKGQGWMADQKVQSQKLALSGQGTDDFIFGINEFGG